MTTEEVNSGIYVIANTKNGKIYIGSTGNLDKRWIEHRSALQNSAHCNPHLQSSWNKYGEKVFEFDVLEYVNDLEKLVDIEQLWMDKYREEGRELYNIALVAGAPMRGRRHSKETRQQMSESHVGSTKSKETRDKISKANEGNQHFLGHKHSKETKCQISKSRKGIVFSDEHKRNIGKAHAKPYPAFVNGTTGEVIPAGINLQAMCRNYGLNTSCMRDLFTRKRQRQHRGWALAGV